MDKSQRMQMVTRISLSRKLCLVWRPIEGYQGGYVLRRERSDETEFLVVNFFESLEAVIRFAGPDYSSPFSSQRQRHS